MISLRGRNAAVLGVADRESIAWAIACALSQAGARVQVGYQHKFHSRVQPLLESFPKSSESGPLTAQRCDVLNTDEVEAFFLPFEEHKLDILVHSVAFGPPSVFTRPPSEVTAIDFSETLEISAHSLAKVVHHAKARLNPGASVTTLSFQAAQRAMPIYGMMGVAKSALESLVRYLAVELGPQQVRVNAVSPGPIETLAALSEILALKRNPEALRRMPGSMMKIVMHEVEKNKSHKESNFEEDELRFAKQCWGQIQKEIAQRSPLPETVTAEDVAQTVLFLSSDASRKITGQIIHVDCGLSAALLL